MSGLIHCTAGASLTAGFGFQEGKDAMQQALLDTTNEMARPSVLCHGAWRRMRSEGEPNGSCNFQARSNTIGGNARRSIQITKKESVRQCMHWLGHSRDTSRRAHTARLWNLSGLCQCGTTVLDHAFIDSPNLGRLATLLLSNTHPRRRREHAAEHASSHQHSGACT